METRKAYDLVAENYAREIPDAAFEAELDLALIRLFVDLLGDRTRVLDAGCGTGRMSAHLQALHPPLELTGVDLSPGMLAQARSAVPDVDFVEGDLAALPFAAGSFAGALAWYSIIHTPDERLPEVFAELRRVLDTGGVVLLGFQAGSGERLIQHAYGHEDLDLVAYRHDVDPVAAALVAAGFEVHTRLDRGPQGEYERSHQGFVLAIAS
jgi:ubiquinone/menaquinone biosynthesis C-methylase UbiE